MEVEELSLSLSFSLSLLFGYMEAKLSPSVVRSKHMVTWTVFGYESMILGCAWLDHG